MCHGAQAFACWTRVLYGSLHSRESGNPAHEGTSPQEKVMLIVELNLAGYRFSGEMSDLRRKPLRSMRFNPRAIHWRIPQLRDSRAA